MHFRLYTFHQFRKTPRDSLPMSSSHTSVRNDVVDAPATAGLGQVVGLNGTCSWRTKMNIQTRKIIIRAVPVCK